MKGRKTIRRQMFETYVSALLVVVIIFIMVYMSQTYQMMQKQITDSMTQLSENVTERLDDEVKQISLLSERIIFSQDVRKIFFEKLPKSQSPAETYRLTNQLDEILYGIIGPKLGFYHMNIVNLVGNRYAFGQEYNYKALKEGELEQIPWLDKTVAKGSKLEISPTRMSTLNKIPEQVVSLSRGFGAMIGGSTDGAVEIQIAYEGLKDLIISTAYLEGTVTEERKVIVLDDNGNLIYPIDMDTELVGYYREISDAAEKENWERQAVSNTMNGKKEHIFLSQGEVTDWQVLLVISDKVIRRPIRQLVLQILFLSVLMVIGVGIFSKRVSRVYSGPIYKLYNSVKNLTLADLSSDYEMHMKADVDELEQLNQVFNKMIVRLHESLDAVVEAKNMEMHSRMLALQAQMNPHFLYNTLTVISIMADNGEKENVQWACRNLSDMLSYISSVALHLVYVRDEIAHTKNYIELIEMRYMEDIDFTVDIPREMDKIYIPKLVIQPLVENSVKYATQGQPVWEIHLSAWTEENRWYVCVKDNGNGFSEETVRELKKKIEEIEESGKVPELSLNGMGILNIYLRLRFYYKAAAMFKIENRPGQGAKVMIGGLIEVSDIV